MVRHRAHLAICHKVSLQSPCCRLKVGSVIVHEGSILSASANLLKAPSFTTTQLCTCDTSLTCLSTVHAEELALRSALSGGFSNLLEKSTLYCTHSPCLNCAKLIASYGIPQVVYSTRYRDTTGLDELNHHNIITLQVDLCTSTLL